MEFELGFEKKKKNNLLGKGIGSRFQEDPEFYQVDTPV